LEGFVEEKNYNAPIIEDFNEKPIVEDIVFNNNQKDFKEGKSIIEETKEKETLVEKKINEDFAANPIIEENKPLIEKYAPIENEEKNGNSIDDIIKTESNNIYEKETLKNPYTNNIKETKKEEILNPINVATYQEDKKPIEDIFNVGNDEDFLS